MNNVNLSIITVTFNNEDHISSYLNSLFKYLPKNSELIIIDNSSNDKTIEKIKKSGKKIRLIENKENIGFAKACNQGVKFAKGKYFFLLNPDTEIFDNSPDKLLSYLKEHPEVGIVAPKLTTTEGIQESVRKFPTLSGLIKEYYLNIKNSYNQYLPKGEGPKEVEAVYGAAIMLPKKIFDKVGGFDEKYFLYYEDIDLCRKIKSLGLKIIYFPQAKIKHLVGGSRTQFSSLPPVIRTLAHFIPIKDSGRIYHQIDSSNIYHGFLKTFIMRLLIYIALKLKIYNKND